MKWLTKQEWHIVLVVLGLLATGFITKMCRSDHPVPPPVVVPSAKP